MSTIGSMDAQNAYLMGELKGLEGVAKEYNLNNTKLDSVSRSFESMFIYMLLKEMRKTIPDQEFLPSMRGKDVYEMIIDSAIADDIAKSSPFGIKDLIKTSTNIDYD